MPGHRIGSLPRRPIKRVSRICCAVVDSCGPIIARARFVADVQDVLRDALAVRDRYRASTISAHGVTVARGHLITRLNDRLTQPSTVPDVERFGRHLTRTFPAIWTFLFAPSIDATNWRAEQALRPAIVTRKVCGGNRSWHGADSQHILVSAPLPHATPRCRHSRD